MKSQLNKYIIILSFLSEEASMMRPWAPGIVAGDYRCFFIFSSGYRYL